VKREGERGNSRVPARVNSRERAALAPKRRSLLPIGVDSLPRTAKGPDETERHSVLFPTARDWRGAGIPSYRSLASRRAINASGSLNAHRADSIRFRRRGGDVPYVTLVSWIPRQLFLARFAVSFNLSLPVSRDRCKIAGRSRARFKKSGGNGRSEGGAIARRTVNQPAQLMRVAQKLIDYSIELPNKILSARGSARQSCRSYRIYLSN